MLLGFLGSGFWCAYVTPLNTVHGFIANAPNMGIDAMLALFSSVLAMAVEKRLNTMKSYLARLLL
jgi:hypothetical protein